MRHMLSLVAVLIGACIGFGVSSGDAEAGAVPAVSSPVVASALIVEAGWRRNYRRYGPNVIVPDVDVDVDVDVIVPGEMPPLIAIVPVRPASCGQYRYWDGDRCVDARYHNPYIGPR